MTWRFPVAIFATLIHNVTECVDAPRAGDFAMTATEKRPAAPDPYEEPLADVGKAAVIVPLIIGGAVIVAIILLWFAQDKKIRASEAARIEVEVRGELRAAYLEMRSLRPEIALEKADRAGKLLASIKTTSPADFAEIKVPLLLLEGESLFMHDCTANAPEAERRFDTALALMTFASGEMWQFGMLGRARTRFEQGKYHEALADLDNIMDRNPSFGSAYYWRSLTLAKLGDDAGAAADEKKARSLDSWPPLRDFMQASCVWNRDILNRPEAGAF